MQSMVVDRYLRYSEIADYISCQWRHDKKFNQGLISTDLVPARDFGSAFHIGIAAAILAWIDDPDPKYVRTKASIAIEQWADSLIENLDTMGDAAYNEIVQIIRDLQESAYQCVRRTLNTFLKLEEWETVIVNGVPAVELEILMSQEDYPDFVPPGWPGVTAHIDWIARHIPTDTTWIIDHKTLKQLKTEEQEELRLQFPMYQKIAQRLGIAVNGTKTLQVRSTPPSIPAETKGGLSRARIATTWSVYKSELIKRGLDPRDYAEMKTKLDVIFHRWSTTWRPQEEIDGVWNRVILPVAASIARSWYDSVNFEPDDAAAQRSLGSIYCGFCDYRVLCIETLRGHDTTHILAKYRNATVAPADEPLDLRYFESDTGLYT